MKGGETTFDQRAENNSRMENQSSLPCSSEGSSVSQSAFLQSDVKTFRQLATVSSQPDKGQHTRAQTVSDSIRGEMVSFLNWFQFREHKGPCCALIRLINSLGKGRRGRCFLKKVLYSKTGQLLCRHVWRGDRLTGITELLCGLRIRINKKPTSITSHAISVSLL